MLIERDIHILHTVFLAHVCDSVLLPSFPAFPLVFPPERVLDATPLPMRVQVMSVAPIA